MAVPDRGRSLQPDPHDSIVGTDDLKRVLLSVFDAEAAAGAEITTEDRNTILERNYSTAEIEFFSTL